MMKKNIICVSLLVTMIVALAVPTYAASVTDFKDVTAGAWYYDAVDYAATNGLFQGTSNTTFSPDLTMSRGMFATVLGRTAGVGAADINISGRFTDVSTEQYYSPYIYWAASNGIVTGITCDVFEPDTAITREQMALSLYRYAQNFGYDISYSMDKYGSFADTIYVSEYAVTALQWATDHGIINGDAGMLAPQGLSTRAQVAQVFLNFSKLEAHEPEEAETPDWENYNPTYDVLTGKSAMDADGGYYDYDLANEIMAQINELRAENGLNALLYNPKIQGWASIRAYEASISFSHTRPDGSMFNTVGQGALSAENLLRADDFTASWKSDIPGYAADVVAAWYASIGHRQAMLKSASNLGAVACYVKGDNVCIAHLFSQRTLYAVDYLY